MKRQIKFRAWDGEKMVIPDYLNRYGVAFWMENSVLEKSLEIMQFTGLLDVNGKEVYEGDILKHIDNSLYTIEFDIDRCRYFAFNNKGTFALDPDNWGDCEIKGNVHENHELL